MAAERKGKKLRRVEPNRGYYKSQFGITDRNKLTGEADGRLSAEPVESHHVNWEVVHVQVLP